MTTTPGHQNPPGIGCAKHRQAEANVRNQRGRNVLDRMPRHCAERGLQGVGGRSGMAIAAFFGKVGKCHICNGIGLT